MKINELRVGNTIMCQYRDEYKSHTIKSIWYNDEEKLYFVELENGFQCNIDGISPMPLTKEFFENNGFIKQNDFEEVLYYRSEDMRMQVYENYLGWVVNIDNEHFTMVFSNNLKYVHELQNAYYVSIGEELEIEL